MTHWRRHGEILQAHLHDRGTLGPFAEIRGAGDVVELVFLFGPRDRGPYRMPLALAMRGVDRYQEAHTRCIYGQMSTPDPATPPPLPHVTDIVVVVPLRRPRRRRP